MNAFVEGPITDEDKQLTDDYDKYRKDIDNDDLLDVQPIALPGESEAWEGKNEGIFDRLLEYLFYAWFIIGPPLLIFLLYYFRKYYKKHKYIYSSISLLVLLYILFQYGGLLLAMMI